MTVKRIGTSPKVTICERLRWYESMAQSRVTGIFHRPLLFFSNFKMLPSALAVQKFQHKPLCIWTTDHLQPNGSEQPTALAECQLPVSGTAAEHLSECGKRDTAPAKMFRQREITVELKLRRRF
jgi:hypothetical protein